jgi:hypothetical protein
MNWPENDVPIVLRSEKLTTQTPNSIGENAVLLGFGLLIRRAMMGAADEPPGLRRI